jgi:hypothetical protein
MPVYLHGLSTSLPPYCFTKDEARQRASMIFGGKYPQFDRLEKTFDTAGIDKRYSVVPIDWFSQAHGWTDRNAAFMTGAKALFIEAAQTALGRAGCPHSFVWRYDDRHTLGSPADRSAIVARTAHLEKLWRYFRLEPRFVVLVTNSGAADPLDEMPERGVGLAGLGKRRKARQKRKRRPDPIGGCLRF